MKYSLAKNTAVAIRVALVTMVVTGLLYPLAVTGVSMILFPAKSGGSMILNPKGEPVGSELIGQPVTKAGYLQPRPSGAGSGYDANASSGSNLGPTSERLRKRAKEEVERLKRENPGAPLPVPADLVTASASGLDPHLSPESALWQAGRIAAARDVSPERVRALLTDLIEGPTLGFLGERRINVLKANLALDRQLGGSPFK